MLTDDHKMTTVSVCLSPFLWSSISAVTHKFQAFCCTKRTGALKISCWSFYYVHLGSFKGVVKRLWSCPDVFFTASQAFNTAVPKYFGAIFNVSAIMPVWKPSVLAPPKSPCDATGPRRYDSVMFKWCQFKIFWSVNILLTFSCPKIIDLYESKKIPWHCVVPVFGSKAGAWFVFLWPRRCASLWGHGGD